MKPECQIIQGDCRTVLAKLPEKSVHMCVCSPPYWGLRKYEGVEPSVWGGDFSVDNAADLGKECQHEWGDEAVVTCGRNDSGEQRPNFHGQLAGYGGDRKASQGQFCHRCSAWRGLLGLEPRIEMYVEHIAECFRAVKRVLRDDGTLWLNLGDSYAHDGKCGGSSPDGRRYPRAATADATGQVQRAKASGLAPKNLIGQPWRVAFALQADGWILRSDIIWHKPNPMPESVTDRPTRAHEHLFLLTLKPKYYYDAEAVREKVQIGNTPIGRENAAGHKEAASCREDGKLTRYGQAWCNPAGRNRRSVWTIPTEANPEAHFASFPRKLVLPCVLAGTSEKGCCPECGTPWVRVVEKPEPPRDVFTSTGNPKDGYVNTTLLAGGDRVGSGQKLQNWRDAHPTKTLGWRAGCDCVKRQWSPFAHSHEDKTPVPIPCTVLDLFVGSGTAGIVATQQGRNFIGIDASAEYCDMARRRIADPEPEPKISDVEGQMRMFEGVTA